MRAGDEAIFRLKALPLGWSIADSQATRNDLPVFPLMLENESFLAVILGVEMSEPLLNQQGYPAYAELDGTNDGASAS